MEYNLLVKVYVLNALIFVFQKELLFISVVLFLLITMKWIDNTTYVHVYGVIIQSILLGIHMYL
jgi:hypothetical protein